MAEKAREAPISPLFLSPSVTESLVFQLEIWIPKKHTLFTSFPCEMWPCCWVLTTEMGAEGSCGSIWQFSLRHPVSALCPLSSLTLPLSCCCHADVATPRDDRVRGQRGLEPWGLQSHHTSPGLPTWTFTGAWNNCIFVFASLWADFLLLAVKTNPQ